VRRTIRKTIRKQKARVAKDATLLRGIKQGVGMVVKRPFGSSKRRTRRPSIRSKCMKSALCALTNIHLPLPRAVGAYTVAKTTTVISSSAKVILFGPLKGNRSNHPDPAWTNVVAVSGVTPGSAISATANATLHVDTALGGTGFAHARLVPAAVTLQVMCPRSLQTADGITYIGRTKQVLDLMGDTRTWTALADELVSFSAPRLCSAGKLALRGVKCDAVPNNMSQLSDFTPRGVVTGADDQGNRVVTWTEGSYDSQFEGFAPIFCYNKDEASLQYLVTVEWRTRFDPANPAYAGHVFHPVASDSVWSETIKGMETEGHGVVDMADGIVDFGEAAMGAVEAIF